MYKEGTYFKDPKRHSEDTKYKVKALKRVALPFFSKMNVKIGSYADVGCGSGEIVKSFSKILIENNHPLKNIKGFDVSPHVEMFKEYMVNFIYKDFTKTKDRYDLVSLNDVFEHIPNVISFLNEIGKRSKYVIMHIPLEDCLNVNIRNLQVNKIVNPGHLLFLNINSALNLITCSGLKIMTYGYSRDSINAPSNRSTLLQKLFYPLKKIFIYINPYLYSKLFGISAVIIAEGIEAEL